MDKVNLIEKFTAIDAPWSPRIVGEVDDHDVKIARIEGEFVWHAHEDEDELFLVLDGEFRMEFRDRNVDVKVGEMLVVPKGVEHRPVAERECKIMMIEKKGTINTGEADDPRRVDEVERI